MSGFTETPSEPDLHVSAYPALPPFLGFFFFSLKVPAWSSSWHSTQSTIVLRRRSIICRSQGVFPCKLPSLRTWWTSTWLPRIPHHSHSLASRRFPSSLRLWYIHVLGLRSTGPYRMVAVASCLVEEMRAYSLTPFPACSRVTTYRFGPFLRLLVTFLMEHFRFPA